MRYADGWHRDRDTPCRRSVMACRRLLPTHLAPDRRCWPPRGSTRCPRRPRSSPRPWATGQVGIPPETLDPACKLSPGKQAKINNPPAVRLISTRVASLTQPRLQSAPRLPPPPSGLFVLLPTQLCAQLALRGVPRQYPSKQPQLLLHQSHCTDSCQTTVPELTSINPGTKAHQFVQKEGRSS